MLVVKCVLLLFCYHQLLGGAVSEFTPTVYTTTSSSSCGQYDPLQDERLMKALQRVEEQLPKNSSCKSIHNANSSAASGYYQINATNGSLVQVYCDMEGTNCGGEGGWTRVAFVNMTKPGATCPQGLEQMAFNGAMYCGRFSSGSGCVSAVVDNIISYQQVCGRVLGYEQDGPDAFRPFTNSNANINQKFTLMDWLLCVVILVGIYGHILLGLWTFQLDLTAVHVMMVLYNQFLLLLKITTIVNLVLPLMNVTTLSLLMTSYGMDSSAVVRRLPAVLTSTCRGSSRHSARSQPKTLN